MAHMVVERSAIVERSGRAGRRAPGREAKQTNDETSVKDVETNRVVLERWRACYECDGQSRTRSKLRTCDVTGREFLSATREMKSKDEAATDRPARATSITLKNTAGGAKRAKGRHTFRSPSCAPVCSFTVENHSTPN